MKLKKHAIRKFKNIQAFSPVLVVALLITAGAVVYNFNARAATSGFYFTTSTESFKVGDTFNVSVYENSGDQCANVVQADFSYPTNLLKYNSFSASGSKFEASAQAEADNGVISLIEYTSRKECGTGGSLTSGVAGEQLVGTVSFTVLAPGNAPLNFLDSTIAISAQDNTTNVATGNTSKSIVLTSAPVTVTPPPANPGNPPTPPTPPTPPRPSTPPRPGPVTSVTTPGNDTPIILENNDTLEIETPVEIQPLPVQPDGVNRVEYYLNGELVATVKTAPYKFKLDPTKYLNGTYTMTTKTYYSNGQTKSVNQKVVVNNAFGFSQIKLWIKKFAWLLILILLVLGAAVAAWIIHRRKGGDNYYGNGSLDNTGDYAVSSGTFIQPSGSDAKAPSLPAPDANPVAAEPQVYKPNDPTAK